jgi:hypothetical protein
MRSFGASPANAMHRIKVQCHAQKRRKKVEMFFAYLKRILGLGRLRLRGPCGVQDELPSQQHPNPPGTSQIQAADANRNVVRWCALDCSTKFGDHLTPKHKTQRIFQQNRLLPPSFCNAANGSLSQCVTGNVQIHNASE